MSNIPEELKYAKSHEWARLEDDGTVTVGISDHAQAALGDLVFVELAEVNSEVSAEDTACVVESVKAASDVYAPIAGEIIEANESLSESPELVNSDPYGDGWLFRIRPLDERDLDELMSAQDYQDRLSAEE